MRLLLFSALVVACLAKPGYVRIRPNDLANFIGTLTNEDDSNYAQTLDEQYHRLPGSATSRDFEVLRRLYWGYLNNQGKNFLTNLFVKIVEDSLKQKNYTAFVEGIQRQWSIIVDAEHDEYKAIEDRIREHDYPSMFREVMGKSPEYENVYDYVYNIFKYVDGILTDVKDEMKLIIASNVTDLEYNITLTMCKDACNGTDMDGANCEPARACAAEIAANTEEHPTCVGRAIAEVNVPNGANGLDFIRFPSAAVPGGKIDFAFHIYVVVWDFLIKEHRERERTNDSQDTEQTEGYQQFIHHVFPEIVGDSLERSTFDTRDFLRNIQDYLTLNCTLENMIDSEFDRCLGARSAYGDLLKKWPQVVERAPVLNRLRKILLNGELALVFQMEHLIEIIDDLKYIESYTHIVEVIWDDIRLLHSLNATETPVGICHLNSHLRQLSLVLNGVDMAIVDYQFNEDFKRCGLATIMCSKGPDTPGSTTPWTTPESSTPTSALPPTSSEPETPTSTSPPETTTSEDPNTSTGPPVGQSAPNGTTTEPPTPHRENNCEWYPVDIPRVINDEKMTIFEKLNWALRFFGAENTPQYIAFETVLYLKDLHCGGLIEHEDYEELVEYRHALFDETVRACRLDLVCEGGRDDCLTVRNASHFPETNFTTPLDKLIYFEDIVRDRRHQETYLPNGIYQLAENSDMSVLNRTQEIIRMIKEYSPEAFKPKAEIYALYIVLAKAYIDESRAKFGKNPANTYVKHWELIIAGTDRRKTPQPVNMARFGEETVFITELFETELYRQIILGYVDDHLVKNGLHQDVLAHLKEDIYKMNLPQLKNLFSVLMKMFEAMSCHIESHEITTPYNSTTTTPGPEAMSPTAEPPAPCPVCNCPQKSILEEIVIPGLPFPSKLIYERAIVSYPSAYDDEDEEDDDLSTKKRVRRSALTTKTTKNDIQEIFTLGNRRNVTKSIDQLYNEIQVVSKIRV